MVSFLLFGALTLGLFFYLRFVYTKILRCLFEKYPFSINIRRKIRFRLLYLSLAFYFCSSLSVLKIDHVLYQSDFITIKLTNFFAAILVLIGAQILDAILTRIRQSSSMGTRSNSLVTDERSELPAGHTTQWLVHTISGLVAIKHLQYRLISFRIKRIFSKLGWNICFYCGNVECQNCLIDNH